MAEITNTQDIGATDHQVDRISDLPDDVISNILSRLPTIQALRTSVLSRDWKHKWTSVYNIEIDAHEILRLEASDRANRIVAIFRTLVDKVLDSNRFLSITSVRLINGYSYAYDSSILFRWISKLVSLGIENLLIVGMDDHHTVVLPRILEGCTSLTELHFSLRFTWEVHVNNCFPKLKKLHLRNLNGNVGIINKQSPKTGQLLLSFPVLENLQLGPYFVFLDAKFVEIDVPELISLEVRGAKNPSDYVMKIRAPKLVRFVTYKGPVCDVILSNKPSLGYVDFWGGHREDFWGGHRESEVVKSQVTNLFNLLKRAPNLEFLSFAGEITTVQVLPTFNQLKRLMLRDSVKVKEIWKFLQVTPYLESLTVYVFYGDHIHFPETLPPCAQLKQVTFGNFRGQKLEKALVEFFLQNAKKLEEVVVVPLRKVDMEGVEITSWMRCLGPQNSSRITVSDEW